MSIVLLAPLGLAALAALALPLVIHLVRRLELTTTDFAALRWISERTRAQRRLYFERPWLLLIRLVLLALLAVLLARPAWRGDGLPARAWVVVAPGAALADARAAAGAVDGEWHWLAPDFPPVGEAPPTAPAAIASLLRELDATLPPAAALTVVVPQQLAGLDGERPRLSREADWRIVAGSMPDAAASTPEPVRLAVRHAAESEPALRYLRAAVAAWNQRGRGRYELDAQPADVPVADAAAWLVWLAPPSPVLARWLDAGGIALVANDADVDGEPLWRDAHGGVLAHRMASGKGRRIALHGGLTPADLPALLDADFPDRLRAAFDPLPVAPARAPAAAMRPRVEAGPAASPLRSPDSAWQLDAWMALLVAGLFLLERVVASRVRTASAA